MSFHVNLWRVFGCFYKFRVGFCQENLMVDPWKGGSLRGGLGNPGNPWGVLIYGYLLHGAPFRIP